MFLEALPSIAYKNNTFRDRVDIDDSAFFCRIRLCDEFNPYENAQVWWYFFKRKIKFQIFDLLFQK